MGKKKVGGAGPLGRTLIKERFNASRGKKRGDSWIHTSELNDGYDWGRLNLQSVTEQSSMDDFLATAELAGTEFVAEKLNIKFVPVEARAGLITSEERIRLKQLHEENKHFLRIPRRPHWDEDTSAEVLQQAEKDSFLEWRRKLAHLEEEQKLFLTPFERNLEFWRQLWRVIERSDVVVQIVDGRNPLLFRSSDLELYVKEVSEHKVNMVLVNKADLLTRQQRRAWATYFQKQGLRAVFWSALAENERLEAEEKGLEVEAPEIEEIEESDDEEDGPDNENFTQKGAAGEEEMKTAGEEEDDEIEESGSDEDQREKITVQAEDWNTCSEDEEEEDTASSSSKSAFHNSSRLLRKDELLAMFKSVHNGTRCREGELTVGLVGYPNVGKSSTINTIFRNKKVSVSATPGHTKHFQTLFVEPGLCLCDCPGIYGFNIIRPREDEDPDRFPSSEELLMAYGYMRGFMTAHGQPDQSRSARYILKDFVNGKLRYCHPPPHINPEDFQPQHSEFLKTDVDFSEFSSTSTSHNKVRRIENVVDKNFFHQANVRALSKGVQSVMGYKPGCGPVPAPKPGKEVVEGKPWKKHGNRNKKEKVRRLNRHLEA
ncbi:hypothetical protein CesoFtcFv8_000028 [Champsocephalus esox]|uniref:Large subunit GTPase 1 homolog n=1 Tax=Champsocephalus esox TaxID=159716 RepID=A0AAN8E0M3_9TELE|nr:hypothetical protein CesoFtcFv8_000028 [Champsocephalus esox]